MAAPSSAALPGGVPAAALSGGVPAAALPGGVPAAALPGCVPAAALPGVRCAPAAEERGEPLAGTASRVDRWLLVEQTGPWGEASVPASRLGGVLTAALTVEARRLRARLVLIRRPATGAPPSVGGRRVYVVDTRPGFGRTLGRVVAGDDDLAALATLDPAGWVPVAEPLFLVCAHGRHDPCCAIRGRPLAAALAAVDPAHTWECSHIGGDRFAPNALVLPHGLYYGRVPPEAAAELVAASRAGRVLPGWLRGSSAYVPSVQAAQACARATLGLDGVHDLRPLGAERTDDRLRVLLDGGPLGEVAVTLREGVAAAPALLTCHASEQRLAPTWELLSLDVTAPV